MSQINIKKRIRLLHIKAHETTISLDPEQKASLDEQIDMMIAKKYKFLSYNGLRNNSGEWISITQNNKI